MHILLGGIIEESVELNGMTYVRCRTMNGQSKFALRAPAWKPAVMKALSRSICTIAFLLIGSATSSALSFIYSGKLTTVDLVTKKHSVFTAYLVLGDQTPSGGDDGFDVTATLISHGIFHGHKIAGVSSFGTFRSLAADTAKGRQELFSKGNATYDVSMAHHASLGYLLGPISGIKYTSPKILSGSTTSVSGDNSGAPTIKCERTKLTFTLDTKLTDAAQTAGESQADSVNRVRIALENKGYSFP
jgi:hypothetical protein